MRMLFPLPFFSAAAMAALVLALSGCGKSPATLDQREEENPRYREGKALMQRQDFDGAAQVFERILRDNPDMARPHIELAYIYDERKKDPIRAIYHYQTYLAMRPETEKRKIMEELILHAKRSFVETFPNSPEATKEATVLRAEVEALRVQNARLIDALRRRDSGVTGVTPAPVPTSTPVSTPTLAPAPTPAHPSSPEEYTVQSGDTLGRIAQKVYGSANKWEIIYEANKATIPNKTRLQIGQTLLIPRQP